MGLRKLNELNDCALFLYPLLELDKNYDNYMYNVYLSHKEYPDLVSHVYVLFKFSGKLVNSGKLFAETIQDPYLELEKKLVNNENYFSHYDLKGGEYVLFILEFPEKYQEEYNKFIEGKYSEFRDPCKKLILSKFPDLSGILNKSESWRQNYSKAINVEVPKEQEYWHIYDTERETFSDNLILVSNSITSFTKS